MKIFSNFTFDSWCYIWCSDKINKKYKIKNFKYLKKQISVYLIKRLDGDCKLVYGGPRHPQSQGLIERAYGKYSINSQAW